MCALCSSMYLYLIQYYGYEILLKQQIEEHERKHSIPTGMVHYERWDLEEMHPINIGRNLFGVASCMAFLKIIFHFEIHYKFGPILFCIQQVKRLFNYPLNSMNRSILMDILH